MESSYQKAEKKGREILAENIQDRVKDIRFTLDPYCPYDGFLTGNTDLTAVLEVKNRDIPDDEYEDRWLIEEKKAIPLICAATVSGYDLALYIVITKDLIRIWDILPLTLTYTEGDFTPTTATGYKRGGVKKRVAYLKEKDCLCRLKRRK